MNELIKVEVNQNQEPCVTGRELHEFLEIETPYHIWFPRMIEYGFVEDIDFCTEMFESGGLQRQILPFGHAIDMGKQWSYVVYKKN